MKVYIITSAKYEECYIEEWVQYHLNMGFDKIIINDNNPKDYPYKLQDILKKYIDNGKVIVERYFDTYKKTFNNELNEISTEESMLNRIYTSIYNKYKDEFDWVTKLDIDEFLEIPETNNDIKKFLEQDKFNNALSIVFPLIPYCVKEEFHKYYTRLKNNRDRFYKWDEENYMFKSFIRKSNYIKEVSLHYVMCSKKSKKINYMLPNGDDAFIKLFITCDSDDFLYNISCKRIRQYCKYIENKLVPLCHAKHYTHRSIEEFCNKIVKFEGDKLNDSILREGYYKYLKKYPEMFNNPRDLYKLYFIDNINNIKD